MKVLVVGAGPSGLAAAIAAAERGAEVIVFEKRTKSLDKACGEGLMPPGVQWLVQHGIQDIGRPFVGIRYIDGDHRVEGRFLGPSGRAIRRLELSQRLRERAEGLGVSIQMGAPVQHVEASPGSVAVWVDGERIAGDIGVGADGLHGPTARILSRPLLPPGKRLSGGRTTSGPSGRGGSRIGFRFHVQRAPWTDHVEVHWSNMGEAYVTPISDKEIGVAVITRLKPVRERTALAYFPKIISAIEGAPRSSSTRGAGPLFSPTRIRRSGAFGMVGDASGYIDACTGEGLSLSFASAQAWVQLSMTGRPGIYPWVHRRIMLRYSMATRAVLLLTRFPKLRQAVIRGFASAPPVFRLALALVT